MKIELRVERLYIITLMLNEWLKNKTDLPRLTRTDIQINDDGK